MGRSPRSTRVQEDTGGKFQALGGLHPDLFILEVIEQLENENQDTPFTLEGMDGILMLDHDPTLPNLELRFIRSLLRYVPIHQLSHTGSYRLGEHGLQIEDIFPVDKKEELPSWIPVHTPHQQDLVQNRMRFRYDSKGRLLTRLHN